MHRCFSNRTSHCILILIIALMGIALGGCASSGSGSSNASGAASAKSGPRNVLFIAIDDLSNALGCYGDPVAVTPHLDRIASRGVRFDNAYCQLPLCNPSRASVMTGLRPDAIRVYDLDAHFRDTKPNVVTLSQLFRQYDYRVERVGKIYHYNVPASIGTDGKDDKLSWDKTTNPKGRDTEEEHLITNAEPHRKISAALCWLAADGTDEEQTDGMIATEAIKIMETNKDRPFFLGVGFFRPHTPYVAPKKYFKLFPMAKIKYPYAPEDDRDDIPAAAFAHNCPVPNYNLPIETCLKAKQAYYATVSFVDAQIGRMMKSLDRLGLADNTVIVVWSDHGYHLGEHQGIWQKRCLFEESAKAPLIVYSPGAKGNGKPCKRVVEFVDIYPTVAELCGLKAPADLAGRSLKPLLNDPSSKWKEMAITQVLRPGKGTGLPAGDNKGMIMGRSVRTERWRYTEWNGGADGAELYDHSVDPKEFKNLIKTDQAKAVIPGLKKMLEGRAQPGVPNSPVNPKRL
jgi:iduronate 2-sulfatase